MNWTKTPPTKLGAYWWRRKLNDELQLVQTLYCPGGVLDVQGSWGIISVALRGGEWCGPLVPAEEVEKAYFEGHSDTQTTGPIKTHAWSKSRAGRVALGEVL